MAGPKPHKEKLMSLMTLNTDRFAVILRDERALAQGDDAEAVRARRTISRIEFHLLRLFNEEVPEFNESGFTQTSQQRMRNDA